MLKPFNETKQILLGLDLGQQQDFSALAIIEIQQRNVPVLEPAGALQFDYGKYTKDGLPFHLVRHLTRYPLGTSYPDIVKMVINLFHEIEKKQKMKPVLVIDSTGVGKPVFDMFVEAGLRPKGIVIHGGATVTREGSIFNTPKRDLVGTLQVLFQNNRIKISGNIPAKKVLEKELLNFKVKITDSGHDTYEAWRTKDHDDTVLAVACACWFGEKSLGKRIKTVSKAALGLR